MKYKLSKDIYLTPEAVAELVEKFEGYGWSVDVDELLGRITVTIPPEYKDEILAPGETSE